MSPTFVLVGASAMLFWLGVNATLPVLPRFVRDELGGGDVLVGLVVGSIAIGAIVARPRLGRLGDRRGRRLLVSGGAALASFALLGHLLVTSVALLFVLRVVLGVGQAALMVGATTFAVDLAPVERRGEATAYTLVAMHLGIGSGPLVGEWVLDTWGFDAVWIVAAAIVASSAVLGWQLSETLGSDQVATGPRPKLLHPAGLMPGVVLGVGILGWLGYNAFVPLFGDEIGVDNVAPLFLVSSATVIAIRAVGARLPDRLGPIRGASLALALMAVGLFAIGTWQVATGLYLGTFVMALGSSLLFPSLVSAAVEGVPMNERSSAMATFTLFIDLSSAAGVVIFGSIAAGTSYATAFLVGSALTLVALAILRATRLRSR